ncbi:MAG: hypothetical protein AB7V18_19550 [Pyrinomonadaceae bacterium]
MAKEVVKPGAKPEPKTEPIGGFTTLEKTGARMGVVDAEKAGLLEDGVYFDSDNNRIVVSMALNPRVTNNGEPNKRGQYKVILGGLNGVRPETYCGVGGMWVGANISVPVSKAARDKLVEAGRVKASASDQSAKAPADDGDDSDADLFEV